MIWPFNLLFPKTQKQPEVKAEPEISDGNGNGKGAVILSVEMEDEKTPSMRRTDEYGAEWNNKEHNQKLVGVVGKKRRDVMMECDRITAQAYDGIDGYVKQLQDVQEKIQLVKLKRKANKAI
jgi:hypothetical protein